ncbi:hypothetical protein [Streptomyces sp. NPDC059168]|uniref:hypothetical protein n=1 Tax=Streptomyces sp. NPDC059168 TaxID=3346753 RepID=UPI003689B599
MSYDDDQVSADLLDAAGSMGSSMMVGSVARTVCGSRAGRWIQLPGLTSDFSSPSTRSQSALDDDGQGRGVLGQFLSGGEREADHAQPVLAVQDAAEGTVLWQGQFGGQIMDHGRGLGGLSPQGFGVVGTAMMLMAP